jgi:hypothetical protein
MVYVALTDGNRLVKRGGSLPYTRYLEPGETVGFGIDCTGQGESSSEDDIVVNATFTENETGEVLTSEDSLTVVRVDFIPELQAPENHCIRRHKVGVREKIGCSFQPSSAKIQFVSVVGDGTIQGLSYTCPLNSADRPIKVVYGNAEYVPDINVVAPNGIEAREVDYWKGNVPTNSAGGIGLTMDLYVKPLDVSFVGIAIQEVPNNNGHHTGYFAFSNFSGNWYHSRGNGAGEWLGVDGENKFGHDFACISNSLSRVTEDGIFIDDERYGWLDGELCWHVPFGWNEYYVDDLMSEFARFAEDTRQTMLISADGKCEVRKFGNSAIRYIDGRIYLNGVQKK